jgi:Tfp pilus assembly protein PilF
MSPFLARESANTFRSRVTEKFRLVSLTAAAFPILFVACVSGSSRVTDKEKANVRYQVGLGFYNEGNYPGALEQFLKARELDPDRAETTLQLGLSYMKLKQYDKAEAEIRPLCEKKSEWGDCWNDLAAVYLEAHKPTKAIAMAEKALKILTYETPELAWANLAQARLQLNRYAQALAAVKRAEERMPENCGLKVLQANILIEQGAYEDGLREAKLATMLCPQEGVPHLWEAYAYYKLGDNAKAERKYHAVIEQFRRGAAAEQGVLALDLMKRHIPLSAPHN